MPVAAPLIGAAISGLSVYATGATFFGLAAGFASAAAAFATTFVLGLASSLLTPKPKSSFAASTGLDGSRTTMVRQATPPMEVIYGELRKGGALVLAENTQKNKYIHLVVVVACHKVHALNTVYVNGDPIFNSQINPSTGAVTGGKYAGKIWIKKHLGGDNQETDSNLLANISKIDSNFRLRGCAYLYVWYETDRDVFPSGVQITVRVQGLETYDPRTDSVIYHCNPALMWRDYMINNKYGRKELPSRISDTHVQASANTNDEFVNCKPVNHVVSGMGTVSNSLKLAGDILQYQTGDRVEVTSTSSLPSGLDADTDYFIIIEKEQAFESFGIEVRLAETYVDSLSSIGVAISNAGSGVIELVKTGEPRYSASGMFRLTEDTVPAEILDSMLQSMAGFALKPGGQWQVFSGTYQSPAAAYDMDDLVRGIKTTTRQPMANRYNAIRGTYVSPLNYDQPDNYPAIISTAAVAADGGETRYASLDLPWTPRAQTAQRIAKIILGQHRRQETVSLPLNTSGLLVQPGNTIEFTFPRYGWNSKTWTVVDWEFAALDGDADNPPALGVTLMCREIDAGVYDFDPTSEETIPEPPLPSSLPNPFERPLAPLNLVAASGNDELLVVGDGTVISRIKLTFDESESGFVSSYIIRWKESTATAYQSVPVRSSGTGSMLWYIYPVKDGIAYDIEVISTNHLGVSSLDAAAIYNYTVIGKSAPPPRPTTFAVARMADGTRRFTYSLDNPPADVRIGGGFVLRWFLGSTTNWNAMHSLYNGVLTVSPFESNELAAGNYTFALRSIDSSGNLSTDALFIGATLGNPRLRNALLQQFEHPEWPGTKTNCYVDADGYLHALSTQDWDDLPDEWQNLEDTWDYILDVEGTISYESEVIDVGADLVFTPLITVEGRGTPTIEIKTGMDADGTVVGSYGAPPAQITARYLQVKVTMVETNPVMTSLTIIADGDVTVEEFNDIDTDTETAGWFESIAPGHFKVGSRNGDIALLTSAKIVALQNVGPGWTWELISKAETVNGFTGAEFKIYNNLGVLDDATVDIELRGPTSI